MTWGVYDEEVGVVGRWGCGDLEFLAVLEGVDGCSVWCGCVEMGGYRCCDGVEVGVWGWQREFVNFGTGEWTSWTSFVP